MRWTLLVLSALALLAIVADTVLTATVAPGAAENFNAMLLIGLAAFSTTAQTLALAAGIIALVAAAQRRQWGWFAGVLVLLLVSVYRLNLSYWALVYIGLGPLLGHVPPTALDGTMQAVTPLATLIYSFWLAEPEPHKPERT